MTHFVRAKRLRRSAPVIPAKAGIHPLHPEPGARNPAPDSLRKLRVMEHEKKVSRVGFCLVVALEGVLVFLGNLHHANQQQIFIERFLPLARQLFYAGSYSLWQSPPALYPIWGYSWLLVPGVVLGHAAVWISIVQALLSVAGIFAFYSVFHIGKSYWHVPLFIPFFAVMSVKWPDAIVTALFIIIVACASTYLRAGRKRELIYLGILAALLVNFRTEYLYLPAFLLVLLLLPQFRSNRKPLGTLYIVWLECGLIGLLPWGFHSQTAGAGWRLSSTNDGGVLYISLGQLPGNPWHLRYNDSTAYEYANAQHIADPYSVEGNQALEHAFIADIEQAPVGYGEKVGYNIASAFVRGVYTGEYANMTMSKPERDSVDATINSAHGIGGKLHALTSLPLSKQLPIELEKLLQFCFMLVFLVLLVMMLRKLFRSGLPSEMQAILWVSAGIVVYKLLLVGFIQYEPRHMNPVYLLVLGCALLQSRKNNSTLSS
jgi:hypothetical protein